MRKLIYVPIIHTSADLGSLAKDVTKRGIAGLGEDVWREHRKTVDSFWDAIFGYFDSIDVSGIKIYQDGMIGEGEVGKSIVEEGLKAGSRNYELVSKFLNRGAVLVKTEDFKLVKEERDRLLSVTQTKSLLKRILAFLKYKLIKDTLLDKRDRFIANRINETLGQNETGILFIGAYHSVRNKLSNDIRIKEIKDTQRVKDYHSLLPFYHKHKRHFEELSKYLTEVITDVKN